jgi:dephospho-CoA kinase
MINLTELNIIGLTGISGAGKSLAARIFAEYGFFVIDCDKEAKCVIASGKCAAAVKNAFPEAFTNDEFDRVKMARLVFSDSEKLKQYEKIIFPFIIYEILKIIERESSAGKCGFLLDAPTLYQSGADDFCKKIIAVVAEKSACIQRITTRDNISEADALLRLNSQPCAEFYKEKVDFYIENNSDSESFSKSIKEVIEEIK